MANKFDRIIKENFREPTRWLLKRLTGIQSVELLSVGSKLQRTVEKEADMFFVVTPVKGEPFVAHLEWQATNDKNMPARMLLYHALSHITHKLPVISFVIYIGKARMKMANRLRHKLLNYRYELIDLTNFDPDEFLLSDVPEEVMLAILAGKTRLEEKREVISKVLVRLHHLLVNDPAALSRKLMQLEVLGDLRNVQKIIIEEEEKMAITYKIERDIRYKQGISEEKKVTATKMIKADEPFEKIISFTGLSLDEIKLLKTKHNHK